jgi:hypothetical protein
LVFCGLWSDGILIFVVERTDLWRRNAPEQHAVDFRRSLFRVDPMPPILGVIARASATLFALNRSGAATALPRIEAGWVALVVLRRLRSANRSNRNFVGCRQVTYRSGLNPTGPSGGVFTQREISRRSQR